MYQAEQPKVPGKWSVVQHDRQGDPMPHWPGVGRWCLALILMWFMWGFLTSCTVKRVTIENGMEGVMIDKPFTTLGHQGIRDEVLQPGTHWVYRSTEVLSVPMTPIRIDEPFQDLPTANNNLLDYQTYLVLQITNSQKLIKRYPAKWYAYAVENQYGNIVRKVISTKTFDDIMTNPDTNVDIEKQAREQLLKYIDDNKLPIAIVDMSLGKATPQPDVLAEMNKTASESQRLKTLKETEKAEVQRALSEKKRAEADNAYKIALGMSTDDVKDIQIAKVYAEACMKNANCNLNLGGSGLLAPTPRK